MKVIGRALGFDPVGEARAAEAAGFDGVRVIDHFFSGLAPQPPHAVSHSLSGLAAAAVATEQVLLTQTMLAAGMRHPAECAQAVATIDRISGGRAELGLMLLLRCLGFLAWHDEIGKLEVQCDPGEGRVERRP